MLHQLSATLMLDDQETSKVIEAIVKISALKREICAPEWPTKSVDHGSHSKDTMKKNEDQRIKRNLLKLSEPELLEIYYQIDPAASTVGVLVSHQLHPDYNVHLV